MKTYLDCIPCFFKQALEAARIAKTDRKTQKKILNELSKEIPKFSLEASPPEMGRIIYLIVKKITGKTDPFRKIKMQSNKCALAIYDSLKKKVTNSNDSLLEAIELAIAGNIIDYGIARTLNLDRELKRILDEEKRAIKKENKALFDYPDFKSALRKAKTILYIGDNAGETVFDRILIEEIKARFKDKHIFYAVRGKPIINDVLAEDARMCGIEKIAEIISSGIDAPGTILKLCSKKFLKIFNEADMIISKGQGNFEALSRENRPVFFLFMAKCAVVARHIDCNERDIVLFYNAKK